jgi:hypothetical protein
MQRNELVDDLECENACEFAFVTDFTVVSGPG